MRSRLEARPLRSSILLDGVMPHYVASASPLAQNMSSKQWLPLESNPEVCTQYCARLGISSGFAFHDVYGFDAELLAMVPQPVLAVLLLFPISEQSEQHKREQEARVAAQGQEVSPIVYWTKQTVGNACGTIGLLHACCNNVSALSPQPGSWLDTWLRKTADADPDTRARLLEEDETLDEAHASAAADGQSRVADCADDVNLHFVCFVHVDGGLYELDGRRPFPLRHGNTSQETLLADASAVIVREFVERAGDNLQFNVLALASDGAD